jgi:hypothetical protein
MEETLPRVEPESTGSNESVSAQRRSRWTQTHTIWLLMVLSLLPGLVVAFDRELWTGLPAGIRGAAYLVSAALIAVACGLIIKGGKTRDEP